MKDNVSMFLNLFRLLPAWLIIQISKHRVMIIDEMYHWNKCLGRNLKGFKLFSSLMLRNKEYRNLLCYRIRGGGYFKCNP